MLQSTFFRSLFLPYLLVICLATGGVGIFAAVRLRSVYIQERRKALRDDLQLVSALIGSDVAANRIAQLNQRIKGLGSDIGCRITVIGADGTVLADNWVDPSQMPNHLTRPEILTAINQGEAFQSRSSETVHEDMLYMARRLQGEGSTTYYLRLAILLRDLGRELRMLYIGLGVSALLAVVVAGGVCYHFTRRHTTPILELTKLAQALGRGELSRRTTLSRDGEIGTLGSTFNSMADALQDLLTQSEKDKAQLLAILSSMSEGVIGTDAGQNILFVNEAASTLLGFQLRHTHGKPLWQVVRIEPIIKAAEDAMRTGHRSVFELGKVGGRHLEISLCTFPAQGKPQGLVVMVHDTTQSVRYQELRKEFVANVSHELRTPLTVIKGYVETLRDGAMTDPVKGPEYLTTIERHTSQLSNLVNDLLELSRLESQPDVPRRVSVDMAALTRRVIELLAPAAELKSQTLQKEITRVPIIAGNPDYLERAVANLIDNAIKYTPERGQIFVCTRASGSSVEVEVRDNGIGIPREDLPRIFERFYRVDRSRSRDMGGTGLGLSIVKHIVQAHGGTVEVQSTPGQGSTFRFRLPIAQRHGDVAAEPSAERRQAV